MKNIYLPGSKSISNRVLILAALSGAPVVLEGLLDSDDTWYMRKSLEQFGVIFKDVPNGLRVDGKRCRFEDGVQRVEGEKLYIGNAGTAARFLSCMSLLLKKNGTFTLEGNEYMEKRPQGDLFESLRSVGVDVGCLKTEGFLPVKMTNTEGRMLNNIQISGKVSSQFLSGLLLVASKMKEGLTIKVVDSVPSLPYVKMTLEILKIWGVRFEVDEDFLNFKIFPGIKAPKKYRIPADMSSASYPLAWSVLKKEKICITNFGSKTLQGDEGFLEIIEKVGATVLRQGEKCYINPPEKLLPIGEFNWEKMPDVSMTGMILAAFVEGKSFFTGLESLRVKECDRITGMQQLEKLGIFFKVLGDSVEVKGEGNLKNFVFKIKKRIQKLEKSLGFIEIDSFDDHRIAMCFGIMKSALLLGTDFYQKSPIKILKPECVSKTWPEFWVELADWEDQLRPVSAVVLKKKEKEPKYLIVKKPRKKNSWQFPQGGVDTGESDLRAGKRELEEECGASLKVKFKGERPIGEYKYFFPSDFKRHNKNIVGARVRFFEVEYLDGEVEVDGDEIIDYKWVRKEGFKDYFEENYLRVVQNFL